MTNAKAASDATTRDAATRDAATRDASESDASESDEGRSNQGVRLDWPSVPGDAGASSPARRCLGTAPRRTRVVATIGPASDQPATLAAMQEAGMDVARLPLAHGSIDDAVERLRRVRRAAPEVGILVDLPGPKIRMTPFPEGGVWLTTGSQVVLSPHALGAPQHGGGHRSFSP